MDQDLITLDRFTDPATAGLAQSRLEAAGIPSFLGNEATMGLAWHLNVALGGICLQVPTEHAVEARALLEAPDNAAESGQDCAGNAEDPEADPEPSVREQLARRTVRAGVMGWVLTPLLPYSLMIGIRSLTMPGAMPGRLRIQLWLVTVLDVVLIGVWIRIYEKFTGQ